MKLSRTSFEESGIYGILYDDNGNQIAVTLEHAYLQDDGTYVPKLSNGTYVCQRGMHELEDMTAPFEAFEIMNVPGHTNILLHVGNYNKDSSGCVLLGSERSGDMIINSHITFNKFMGSLDGVDSFTLEVC